MVLLLCSAVALLAPTSATPTTRFIGNSASADVAATVWNHWLVHQVGLVGAAHSRLQMYPYVSDVVVLNGFPLDALASVPFGWVFGWPGGYGPFQIATVWAAGVAMAWLAGRWWRSTAAALVAGVAYQSAAPLVRELAYGRSTQVFGAIFVPLALGFAALALVEGRRRDALLAGLALGACALSYWYYGVFCGIGLLVLIGLAWREGLRLGPVLVAITVGTAAVTLLPMVYTLGRIDGLGGVASTLTAQIRAEGMDMRLVDLLEKRDLVGEEEAGSVVFAPVLFGLAAAGVWGSRGRRWGAPLLWLVIAVSLALGPYLTSIEGHPIPGPFLAFAQLPVLRRLWWPDRALLLAAPAVAVLAGGGAARLGGHRRLARVPTLVPAVALAAVLLVEAFLAHPDLPLPSTSALPSPRAAALTLGAGPLLVLPQVGGPNPQGNTIPLDQVFHGRPLVNGLMPPNDASAPATYRAFSESPPLAHLYGCAGLGHPWEGNPAPAVEAMTRLGIREVAVDVEQLVATRGDADPFLACVASLLGEPATRRGPYEIWRLDPG